MNNSMGSRAKMLTG